MYFLLFSLLCIGNFLLGMELSFEDQSPYDDPDFMVLSYKPDDSSSPTLPPLPPDFNSPPPLPAQSSFSLSLSAQQKHTITFLAKKNKTTEVWAGSLPEPIVAQLGNEDVCQLFKDIPLPIVNTVLQFCNLVRVESLVKEDSGIAKVTCLTLRFEEMAYFLKALLMLSALPKKVITEVIRNYVDKAEKRKIYLNNHVFHSENAKDREVKLEIDKWYFLKYSSHLDIPRGTFPAISIADLIDAGKKITVSTVEKMQNKLVDIEQYGCSVDDIVLLLNNYSLTLLDGLDKLLDKLELNKDKIVVIDLRGNNFKLFLTQFFKDYKGLRLIYLQDTCPLCFHNE